MFLRFKTILITWSKKGFVNTYKIRAHHLNNIVLLCDVLKQSSFLRFGLKVVNSVTERKYGNKIITQCKDSSCLVFRINLKHILYHCTY